MATKIRGEQLDLDDLLSVSEPATQIVFGTGSGISSDVNLTWDGNTLTVTGVGSPQIAIVANGDIEMNSQMRGSDGDATTPTYSFTSAPTSGMYLDSGDLAFAVDGTELLKLEIDGSDQIINLGGDLDVNGYDILLADSDGFEIKAANSSVAGTAASISLTGQTSSTSSGGAVIINGGDTTATGFVGGSISIIGGDGQGASSSNGGNIVIRAGDGVTSGGDITLEPGIDTTDQTSQGAIYINSQNLAGVGATVVRFREARVNGVGHMGLKAPDSMPNSALDFDLGQSVVTKSATSETVVATDDIVLVDASSNNVAITLHTANLPRFRPLFFKRIDASGNTVTVQRTGGDTIDGGTSFNIVGQYTVNMITNDNQGGTSWYVII